MTKKKIFNENGVCNLHARSILENGVCNLHAGSVLENYVYDLHARCILKDRKLVAGFRCSHAFILDKLRVWQAFKPIVK